MGYKYKFTTNAIRDIDDIVSYITFTLCNKEAADDFLKKFDAAISRACEFPYGYPSAVNTYYLRNDIRKMIVKKYIVYYKVDDDKQTLIILGVRHSTANAGDFLKNY